jgi:uncharacterized integral membrane protein (TIGR00697 family)
MSTTNEGNAETSPGHSGRPARFASGGLGNYDIVLALFCAFLLISNIGAAKLIGFGPTWSPGGVPILPIITDGGAFLFPLTYIFGDVLAEVYGMKKAKRAIVTGFVLSITASVVFLIVGIAPAAPDWPNQAAWDAILGVVPRMVLASLLGYLFGQLLNAYVLVWLKRRFGEDRLWIRLIGSTVVGEMADTLIFCTIAWAGQVSLGTFVNYVIVGYVYKVLIEVILLPITYRVVAFVKRREPDYL